MGYTPMVMELPKGKANVSRPKVNCGPTTRYLQSLDSWLAGPGINHPANTQWDVIHFNAGLHELNHLCRRYRHAALTGFVFFS